MNRRLLELVVCPVCGGDLAEHGDVLACEDGHSFPVVAGVPRLITSEGTADAKVISKTFGHQWGIFDYDEDRTWGSTSSERLRTFLADVGLPVDWFRGKAVLDAGCGNGVLSHAISALGCEVLATDVSPSVEAARRRFAGPHFVQSDLARPAFRSSTFDVVYSGGVLHHTPNTRASLARVVEALAPGGRIYVWLYWKVPGVKYRLRSFVRRAMAPLPNHAKHVLLLPVAAQGAIRHGNNLREELLVELDFFTPRYRWEHTPDEVGGWFRELGFDHVETRSESRDGFGVLAQRG